MLLRAYYLLKSVAERHSVDLVAFVQRPLLETFYPTLDEGLADSRRILERFWCSVTFLQIASMGATVRQGAHGARSATVQGLLLGALAQERASKEVLSPLAKEQRYDLVHLDGISLAPY